MHTYLKLANSLLVALASRIQRIHNEVILSAMFAKLIPEFYRKWRERKLKVRNLESERDKRCRYELLFV